MGVIDSAALAEWATSDAALALCSCNGTPDSVQLTKGVGPYVGADDWAESMQLRDPSNVDFKLSRTSDDTEVWSGTLE